jgi:hypothetical protein
LRNLTKFAVAGIAAAAIVVPLASVSAGINHAPAGVTHTSYSGFGSAPVSLGRIYMPTVQAHRNFGKTRPDTAPLTYRNGAVLTVPEEYIILWGFKGATDPDKIAKLMKAYAKVYGGSAIAGVLTQYYQVVGGTTTYISNPTHNVKVWEDNADAVPAHASDSQVQAEAWAGVQHFNGGTADPNGAYIVVSPYHHDPQGFLSSGWCAYHGASSKSGQTISYTNMPYMPDGGSSCGANFVSPPNDETGADEGFTIVLNHEYSESVTDPNPPSGWYNNSFGEIGDECAWTNIQNDPFGAKSYTMQPEYSNKTASCVHSL